jgi:cytochrome c551/c552
MFSFPKPLTPALLALVLMGGSALAQTYPNIGRVATPKEVKAWDIDVRPDFKGLPAGSGSVAKGMDVWESKCASCHGVFGESNEVFSPLVGGTTEKDLKTGRVPRLMDESFPGRSTMMKLSTVATLWDYINRAMPWTQPKSLSTEEVYAVTGYLLHLGGVLPESYVLSDRNIAEVQALLPNRNGMQTEHGLWPGKGMGNGGRPDVKATACMSNCATEPRVVSFLPDHARNAHGNLAEQNRAVGAQRGADTTQPPQAGALSKVALTPSSSTAAAQAPKPSAASAPAPATPTVTALLNKHSCSACHGVDKAIVGPGFQAIARKHAGRGDLEAYLRQKIKAGSQGVWGSIPMPAQSLPDTDAAQIAKWIADGAKR